MFKPLAVAIAALTIPVLLLTAQPTMAVEKRFITIGTGGVNGVYYPAGGAICRLVNKERKTHGIRCSAESTDGSAYNLDAIRSGDLDMGIMQSDVHHNAYRGIGKLTDNVPFTELRSMFSLHPEPFTVVVRADSDIKQIDDLKGKRVNIGNPGSGQRITMEILMKAKGWDKSAFSQALELRSQRQPSALCQKQIDAMIFTVGHPSDAIIKATSSCDSRIIEVSGKEIEQLVADHSFYRTAVIPAALYRGNDKAVSSFGVGATVVTSSSSSDALVYTVVKAVFENFESFKQLHPALVNLEKQQMIRDGLTAPLHPGAVKYYKEAGLM